MPDHVDAATGYRWYADTQLDQARVVAYTEPRDPDEFRVRVPPGTRTVQETGNLIADQYASTRRADVSTRKTNLGYSRQTRVRVYAGP